MFAKAYEIASQYTQPVISSIRLSNNKLNSSIGSFIILNNDGWMLTCAHLFNDFIAYNNSLKETKELEDKIIRISDDKTLVARQKENKINALRKASSKKISVINHSFWWGRDNVNIGRIIVNGEIDLALVEINNFNPNDIKVYPKFKNSKNFKPGTFLCKLGHPFHNIGLEWDNKTSSFILDKHAIPIPRFPIEGMFTRNANAGKSKDGNYNIHFIETSTPGLRGQSGGPIFDSDGYVWGIQSRTHHFPLGFNPKSGKGSVPTPNKLDRFEFSI